MLTINDILANGIPECDGFEGASICVEIGRHTIDPQGLANDDEVEACEAFILDAVREAFPGADVRIVGNGGRTGALRADGWDFSDELEHVVTRAYSDFFAG